jgi:hypothetical protein
MPQPRAPRKTITIDLTPEQIAWLDRQAADLDRSRSSFLRTLITAQMKRITE